MNLVDPDGRLPILPIIWGFYEIGSFVYDIYNAYDVLSNENSTTGEKVSSLTGLAMTIFLPGNWGTAANKVDDVIRYADDAIRYTDDVVDAGRVVNKADDVVDAGKTTKTLKEGPKPNGGKGGKHGNPDHNKAIDDAIKALPKKAKNIRKNQAQVDINGNKVGNNRPDIQYDLNILFSKIL